MALYCTAQLTPCVGCRLKLRQEAQPFERACNVSGLARSRPNATPGWAKHGPPPRCGQDRVRGTASGEASLD